MVAPPPASLSVARPLEADGVLLLDALAPANGTLRAHNASVASHLDARGTAATGASGVACVGDGGNSSAWDAGTLAERCHMPGVRVLGGGALGVDAAAAAALPPGTYSATLAVEDSVERGTTGVDVGVRLVEEAGGGYAPGEQAARAGAGVAFGGDTVPDGELVTAPPGTTLRLTATVVV